VSKTSLDQLLDKGRILLDGRSHAVVEADPSKEVRQCSRCLKFGHLAKFCRATEDTCAKCAGPHSAISCDVLPSEFKCKNCNQGHSAASRACPSYAKAVAQYQSYNST
jgi:hypothetical protein